MQNREGKEEGPTKECGLYIRPGVRDVSSCAFCEFDVAREEGWRDYSSLSNRLGDFVSPQGLTFLCLSIYSKGDTLHNDWLKCLH